MSNKISVIVPVYNTEEYIVACLRSIKKQSYENLEVIIVNNNSSDGSMGLIKEEIKEDERFMVIDEKKAGQGHARNTGMRRARGDLLAFVDSDDVIPKDCFKLLYDSMMREGTVMAVGVMEAFMGDEKNMDLKYKLSYPLTSESNLAYVRNLLSGYDVGSCCGVLFKRSLFEGVSFPGDFYYEDAIAKLEVLLKGRVSKVSVVEETIYFYRLNPSSTMRSFNKKHLDSNFFLIDRVKELLIQYDAYPLLKDDYRAFVLLISVFRLYECYKGSKDRSLVKEFYKKIDKNIFNFRTLLVLFMRGKITWLMSIECSMITLHPSLYLFCRRSIKLTSSRWLRTYLRKKKTGV